MAGEPLIFYQSPQDEIIQKIADAVIAKLFEAGVLSGQVNSSSWLDHVQAAAFLMKPESTLYKLAALRIVKYYKRGKKNYYKKEDLEKYLKDGEMLTENEIRMATKLETKKHFKTK